MDFGDVIGGVGELLGGGGGGLDLFGGGGSGSSWWAPLLKIGLPLAMGALSGGSLTGRSAGFQQAPTSPAQMAAMAALMNPKTGKFGGQTFDYVSRPAGMLAGGASALSPQSVYTQAEPGMLGLAGMALLQSGLGGGGTGGLFGPVT